MNYANSILMHSKTTIVFNFVHSKYRKLVIVSNLKYRKYLISFKDYVKLVYYFLCGNTKFTLPITLNKNLFLILLKNR